MADAPALDFNAYVTRKRAERAGGASSGEFDYSFVLDRQSRATVEAARPIQLAVSSTIRLWRQVWRGQLLGSAVRVSDRQFAHLNDMLLAGARAAIEAAGHKHETITVPGALEVPAAIALAARSGRFCAFVALGVVIRGETFHFEIVAQESARGLLALTLDGFAIGNGILTVEIEAQAIARADPSQGDKGGDAARAALALFELAERYGP